jgi:hypothetical protein
MQGNHPPFLILDTPRQHELHPEDLRAFIERFDQMIKSQKPPLQLVLSATESDFVPTGMPGAVWKPEFGTKEKPRFFGPASHDILS